MLNDQTLQCTLQGIQIRAFGQLLERHGVALEHDDADLDIRASLYLLIQIIDQVNGSQQHILCAFGCVQNQQHIRRKVFLRAGQRQGHAGRAVGVERRRGLGFGYLPILRLWLGRQRHDRHRADQHDQRQQTG